MQEYFFHSFSPLWWILTFLGYSWSAFCLYSSFPFNIWTRVPFWFTFSFLFIYFLFKYGWLILLYQFLLYSEVTQLCTYIHSFLVHFRLFGTSLVAQTVKSTMRETWIRALGWEDPLEKEMAIHSSTIAWKIPWTEEPGRLQPMGSQRVAKSRTRLSDFTFTFRLLPTLNRYVPFWVG